MGKKKPKRKARERGEGEEEPVGRSKHYFTLLNAPTSGASSKKYAVPSGQSLQECAFVAAKKAWRDNKLLNKVTVQEISSHEVFHFDPGMWMQKNTRKFQN